MGPAFDECVARVEVEGCQHSPITNEMKWPGEQTIKLGPLDPRGRLFVVFTLATQTKLSIGKHSVVTLASTKVALDAVPKILADEGAWFVEFLPLRGTSLRPKVENWGAAGTDADGGGWLVRLLPTPRRPRPRRPSRPSRARAGSAGL